MVVPRAAWMTVVVVLTALGPFASNALPKEELYPFNDAGSAILKAEPDGRHPTVEAILKTPINFYSTVYDRIYVNGNGILSFVTPMERFFNVPFPLDYPVIAPLYTRVDTRGSGGIYWSETDAPDVVARAARVIQKSFKNAQTFLPTHVSIATWDSVGYFDAKSDKVNTYQVVISSNGSHSYAEFLYPENGIQWIQGESHPGGLPDAKAQAGVGTRDGRVYTLKGSGTDQVQNLDKWSNVNNPGQWVFQLGPAPEPDNIYLPDNIEDAPAYNDIPSCLTGATTCHSKAECMDHKVGFCCICKKGFFGNGRSCQHNDLPLRVSGIVSGTINGEELPTRDLQSYVATPDGRTYTAISRIPEFVGASSQLLHNLGDVIGWVFAKPIAETENGYQLTGGVFNLTVDITFTTTGDKVKISSRYLGLDVFGQLKMETEIRGTLPVLPNDARLSDDDYAEIFTRTEPGTILSQSSRSFVLVGDGGGEYPFTQNVVISYNDCQYDPRRDEQRSIRLKFSRGMTTWEAREQITRFAVNTKVGPLEEEDPCIEGRRTCGVHSTCLVDGDDYKCVCKPGFQYLYIDDGLARCVDINECTTGTHVCSPDASCLNNEGSHVCQCFDGFTGDGRYCEKLPSCEETVCRAFAECNVRDGQPVCSCIAGYRSTDQGCYPESDVGCEGRTCPLHAYCTVTADGNSTECTCEPGYVGDGYTCALGTEEQNTTTDSPLDRPTPECSIIGCTCPLGWEVLGDICVPYYDPEEYTTEAAAVSSTTEYSNNLYVSCNVMNNCHPYAQCVFEPVHDTYRCECNPGYEGNGYECKRNEISCANTCDPNAACLQDRSGPRCVCNSGYEGDGIICTSIDQCSSHDECGPDGSCQYNAISSRYVCGCAVGFNRVNDLCQPADCFSNPSQCHVNARCMSSISGVSACVCVPGFSGDGIHQCIEEYVGCNVINNCGPNAICAYNQSTANYACQCQQGYYGNGFTCHAESSCKRNPNLCSPDATCVHAGGETFACVCNAGFVGSGAECKAIPRHESNILLLNRGMATLRMPFFPTPSDPGSLIHIDYLKMAVAIDIDCFNGRVYWSDIAENSISSMTYNGSDVRTLITNVSSPEGLSIDWVSRNVFWTDSGENTISVANLETQKRKVLISEGLVNPRGIAVHPYRGKFFWSDWNRAAPKLEWANEDGTDRRIFMENEYVKLPNSLAIDWYTDEICWADAGKFMINCANIDTKVMRIVIKELSYPFGLAISQNHYYWTDWSTDKIEIATKNTGERNMPLDIPPGGNNKLYGIVAVPEYCPAVSNICEYEFGRCNQNQLCLPDGQGGRVCACADNVFEPCTDTLM